MIHYLVHNSYTSVSILYNYFAELVALDTEYIDPELLHADSPNIPPTSETCSPVTGPQISNSHATLTHVQSMPPALTDRPAIPISPRPTLDDIPVRKPMLYCCIRCLS